MTLRLRPVSLDEARRYVAEQHRHNRAPKGWKFGVAVERDGVLVGVGMAGRPVGRHLDDGYTVELTRVCTDGTRNSCSKLYGALCRAAAALGYRRAVTYTLASEPGASVRAAGFQLDEQVTARAFHGGRARYQTNLLGEEQRPEETKLRWSRSLG